MKKPTKNINILDKVISILAPRMALEREKARQKLEFINSGYSHHGANTNKKSMLDWNSDSKSPNEDINENLSIMVSRSRDLYMGGANLATAAIKTTRTNAIGSGLVLKPSIDADFLKMSENEVEVWEKAVVREFEYYANSVNCDRFRLHNFYELQQLAFTSMLMSGDVFILMPYRARHGFLYDLRIQLIEADRVLTPTDKESSPNISQGVETRNGEIVAYHISNHFPGSESDNQTFRRIPVFGTATGRRNVLHLMEAERPDQTRGVPFLAPVIDSLRQLGQYTEAELRAALVGGLFTTFVYTEIPENAPGEMLAREDQLDPDNDYTYELGAGSIVSLAPGEKISTASPGRPNVAFEGFVSSIAKHVGASLEIPYEFLIKHFSSSYSASRGALLEAWKMFRMRRKWFANDFCQPIYEEWLTEAVAKGRINAPGFFDDPVIRSAYTKSEWHGPSQGQIDPLREVTAATRRIDAGITTREREAAELTGTDFNVNHRQLVKEETMRLELEKIKLELEIEKQKLKQGG